MADPYASFSTPNKANADPYAAFSARVPSGGVQDYEPEQYTTGQKAGRAVGLAAQGFNDSVADVVGAPVDAAAWLLRQAGIDARNPIGGSASLKKGIDYLASIPGKVGLTSSNAPVRMEPTNTLERFAHGAGEGVGNALSVMMPAGVLANSGRFGPVTTGVLNALTTQPVAQVIGGAAGGGVTEATDNPWLGLAAGAAVPIGASVFRGVVSPTTNRLTPQEARLAAAATDEGIPLTPAQRTGSKSLQTFERTMQSMPGSSGPMSERFGEQRRAFNAANLRRAGLTADEASPEVIDNAFRNAGLTFDDLAARSVLRGDPQGAAEIRAVANDYGRRLPTNVEGVFRSYMDDLEPFLQAIAPGAPGATVPAPISTANPQIAGDVYARIYTGINNTIRENPDSPQLQNALRRILHALDGMVERSTSGALRQEWRDARREYQALMTIDTAMKGGTQTDRIRADIPFNALKQAVVSADPRGFSRGRGQMNELARIGDFIASRVPDSGTAARQATANPLMWPIIAGNRVAAGLYNTPMMDAYLTNQIAGPADFRALYGGLAARQAIEEATGGRNALLRQRGGQ